MDVYSKFIKNIRKFLKHNVFTTKKNKSKYDYIIKEIYKLTFKRDIIFILLLYYHIQNFISIIFIVKNIIIKLYIKS